MSIGMLGQLNWLAVVVAVVVYFALGALWYMPSFMPTGRIWMTAIGFTGMPEGQRPNPTIYLAPLLGYLLVVIVLALLARALGVASITDGVYLAFIVWLGFALPYWSIASVFNPHAKQPLTLAVVQSAYHLIGLLLAGAIIGALG